MKFKAIHIIVLIASLLTVDSSYCQNQHQRPLQVNIAPLNVFDPVTGVFQIGVEKRLSQRIGLSLDYGFKFNHFSFYYLKNERKNYKYYKAKAEIKYFFKLNSTDRSVISNPYMAIQGFYFPQQYRKDSSWIVENGKSYRYAYSNIKRKVVVASILLGEQKYIKPRVVLDYYAGFGIRRMTIAHQPINAVEGYRSEPKEWSPIIIDQYNGVFYRAHMALGIKVGFLLLK